MELHNWLINNSIEIFGAIAGIIYVFLEIRQTIWLWPVGIMTSAVYIWVFFTGKLYADMSLQIYYLIISCLGWYWWVTGTKGAVVEADGNRGKKGDVTTTGTSPDKKEHDEKKMLKVIRLDIRTGVILLAVLIVIYSLIWVILTRFTDSPVPAADSFITSLSIIATWMLARKIYEHWILWITVNAAAVILFLSRELYPTVVLYVVYGVMSFTGLKAWYKTIQDQDKVVDR